MENVTNAERIRGMSDQELVRLIVYTTADGCPPEMDWECGKELSGWDGSEECCEKCWAKWLQRPAKTTAELPVPDWAKHLQDRFLRTE